MRKWVALHRPAAVPEVPCFCCPCAKPPWWRPPSTAGGGRRPSPEAGGARAGPRPPTGTACRRGPRGTSGPSPYTRHMLHFRRPFTALLLDTGTGGWIRGCRGTQTWKRWERARTGPSGRGARSWLRAVHRQPLLRRRALLKVCATLKFFFQKIFFQKFFSVVFCCGVLKGSRVTFGCAIFVWKSSMVTISKICVEAK